MRQRCMGIPQISLPRGTVTRAPLMSGIGGSIALPAMGSVQSAQQPDQKKDRHRHPDQPEQEIASHHLPLGDVPFQLSRMGEGSNCAAEERTAEGWRSVNKRSFRTRLLKRDPMSQDQKQDQKQQQQQQGGQQQGGQQQGGQQQQQQKPGQEGQQGNQQQGGQQQKR